MAAQALDVENPDDFKWPSLRLVTQNNGSSYKNICVPLYKAALNGNWAAAKTILSKDDELPRTAITEGYETVLHVAVGAKQAAFVRELVTSSWLVEQDFIIQDRNGNTAFCLAAATGDLEIVKLLVEGNEELPKLRGAENMTPLYMAALLGHREVAWFIYRKVENQVDGIRPEDCSHIFFACLDRTDLFDLALELLQNFSHLATERHKDNKTALHILAAKPSAFASNSPCLPSRIWTLIKKFVGSKDMTIFMQEKAIELVGELWSKVLLKGRSIAKETIKTATSSALTEAAKLGNYRFIAEIVSRYPDLIWEVDDNHQTIFHIAVSNRHESIFNQIYMIGSIKDVMMTYETEDGYNILHLAAKLPPPSRLNIVSGATLQMQRELRWFKVVESTVQHSYREKRDLKELTPQELFTEEHKTLQKEGEEWMKETAKSCTIITTLIATVVFATAFGVPGGTDDIDGFPHQIKYNLFHAFAVSTALALSLSLISTLIFLSILTSRYAQEDFLEKLPLKLMAGLLTLFLSVIAMMISFSVAIFLAYHSRDQHKLRWIPILAASVSSVPPAVFVVLQISLVREFMRSTFSQSMFRPKKSMFN